MTGVETRESLPLRASATETPLARRTMPITLSSRLRRTQNGFVRSYALAMVLGAAVVGAVIVLGRLG